MKIALLYSGHLRSVEQTYLMQKKFIKLLSENNEVKIFCQTWDEPEANTKTWWNKEEIKLNELFNPNEILTKTIHPDEIVINSNETKLDAPHFYKSKISYEGVYSMFYSINQSYLLYDDYCRKMKWEADVLIKIRYDIEFDIESIINNIHLAIDNDEMIVFSSNTYDFFDSFSDTLLVLPNNNKYSDFFNINNKFLDNSLLIKYFEIYVEFIPEIFISDFVFNNPKFVRLNNNLYLIRTNGDKIEISSLNQKKIIETTILNINNFCHHKFSNKKQFNQKLTLFLNRYELNKFNNFYTDKIKFIDIVYSIKMIVKNPIKENIVFTILTNTINNTKNSYLKLLIIKILCRIQRFL